MQSAWTRQGKPVNATDFSAIKWEELRQAAQPGDFFMPCCKASAALKTSINGLPFFAHFSNSCDTSPETVWHKAGKAAVLATLNARNLHGDEEVPGKSPNGEKWKADILFTIADRTIAIELQRSYQHMRDFTRRQERYYTSGIECYWLVPEESFPTLSRATTRLLLKRDFNNRFPPLGIGTGMLPELPVAILDLESGEPIKFGQLKAATVSAWIAGIINGTYQYRRGSWNLGDR